MKLYPNEISLSFVLYSQELFQKISVKTKVTSYYRLQNLKINHTWFWSCVIYDLLGEAAGILDIVPSCLSPGYFVETA